MTSSDRELVVDGIRPPFRFVAFSGPAYSSVEIDQKLSEISKKKPVFGFLLGGVGDEQKTAIRTIKALAKLRFPVFVLAGGRDSWPVITAAYSSLDRAARDRVIDLNPIRSVRIAKDVFVPIAGAAEGRYARGQRACGFSKEDLKQISEELGGEEGSRRWLLSWQLPAVDAPHSLGRTTTGVDLGDSDLGAFAEEIKAQGGLFSWPYVQVMSPISSITGRTIPVGDAARDLYLVVPRLVGPAMECEDGSYVSAGFAVLRLSDNGIAVESR